ncbi:MAG: thioredoxin [Naasia sp.]|uniref:glutaredoxin family protein n=1 Tax=Naasia sp. TaxID=2546198 RepID=UPI00260C6FBD|nr:glutaredoxin family protein [Naasia sp.]MCU1570642.1 thioredoxin [Naasia sp.]
MPTVAVTLLAKPGCHLCDDARTEVDRVVAELPEGAVSVVERNILEDSELFDRYAEEIPVVLIEGRVHTYWRVDGDRLRRALDQARARCALDREA